MFNLHTITHEQRIRRLEEKVSSTKTKKRQVTEEVSSVTFLKFKKFLLPLRSLIDTIETQQVNLGVPDEWNEPDGDEPYIADHLEKISNLAGELYEELERFESFKK